MPKNCDGSNVDADDPLIVYEGAAVSDSARRYLHADPRGSIVAVTNYQGTAIATNSYDEFGIPDAASGTDIASKGRFRYTGQAWLPELGMYYYKARIYSPTLGRFLQTDPIGYEDQFNLYAYVANDPINGVDPTGMDTCPDGSGDICVTGKKGPPPPPQDDRAKLGVISGPSKRDPEPSVPSPQNSATYLQASPCNRFQQQLQAAGGAIVDVGGAVSVAGGVATGVSAAVAVGGAFTGNVPAAAVGTLGMTAGGAVTIFGGETMLVGSLIGFAGGTSSQELVRNGSDAIINRLPGPGIVRAGFKKVADRVADAVPDFRICR